LESSALAILSKVPEIGNVFVGVGTVDEMEARAKKQVIQLFNTTTPALGRGNNSWIPPNKTNV